MQYNKKLLNKIKIIGGKYKGKLINFDCLDNSELNTSLRPTSNRARETLFNWLMFDIQNTCCLDLFAGSGALSFEALSRGAKNITLIENSKSIYDSLIKTQKSFPKEINKIKILKKDSIDYIYRNHVSCAYDIIFIDPPFGLINKDFINSLFIRLQNNSFLNNKTLIYLESDQNLDNIILENNIEIIKSKKIGSVYIYLCRIK
tara:strand:+ start:6696 stop:7304 length:609 start_codon:yes stop_codon:yes gene_type:complete